MHAIGLGALQQRDVLESWRCGFERAHQIAQHAVVGLDLPGVAPAIDQARRLIECGIDQMGCTAELGRGAAAILGAGEIDRHVPRAVEIARLAARQRDALAIIGCTEVPQGGAADQAGGAGDHDFLVGHVLELPSLTACVADRRRARSPSHGYRMRPSASIRRPRAGSPGSRLMVSGCGCTRVAAPNPFRIKKAPEKFSGALFSVRFGRERLSCRRCRRTLPSACRSSWSRYRCCPCSRPRAAAISGLR